MKTSRIVVAGVAVVAGIAALLLTSAPPPAPPPQIVEVQSSPQGPQIKTTEVLVAGAEIALGAVLAEQDFKWIAFPEAGISDGFIQKTASPEAVKELIGSIARQPFVINEPLRREKLIQANGSGFLSAILPSGKRAVAITTDAMGASSAGGFILPNDRVDVVRIYRDDEASRSKNQEVFKSEMVLTNVRVLAIGQNIQERNGERFITGQTATLELDPKQSAAVVLAQRVGTLSLALRSLQDAAKVEDVKDDGSTGMTIVRFGVPREAMSK